MKEHELKEREFLKMAREMGYDIPMHKNYGSTVGG